MNVKSCIAAAVALLAVSTVANAITIGLVPASGTVAVGDTVDVQLKISDIVSPGIVYIHADLFYDTSVLSLVTAKAGSFFDDNYSAGAGSVWIDSANPSGLLSPDAVDTGTTDVTTLPDVLGFDFLETNLVPSLTDGVLVDLQFDALAVGTAGFNFNDLAVVDGQYNMLTVTTALGDVTVTGAPEPASLALIGIGLGLLGARRRLGC